MSKQMTDSEVVASELYTARDTIAQYITSKRIRFHCPKGAIAIDFLPIKYHIDIQKTRPIDKDICIDIGGITYMHGFDIHQVSPTTKVAQRLKVDKIVIFCTTDRRRIMYHFLHELAHTVTLPELHKKPADPRLQPFADPITDGFYPNHHPPDFYRNLAVLLRAAKKTGIWTQPSDFPGFRPSDLKRYDTFTVA